MLKDISWVVYGPQCEGNRLRPVKLMANVLAVSKYKDRKNAEVLDSLRAQAIAMLNSSKCPDVLVRIFEDCIDFLHEKDPTLCYFILFCTVELESAHLVRTLHLLSLRQDLVAGRLNMKVERIRGRTFCLQNGMPLLPWDISPILNDPTFPEATKLLQSYVAKPVADVVPSSFLELLKNQRLRKAASLYEPLEMDVDPEGSVILKCHLFKRGKLISDLISLYEGIGSDLFQTREDGNFYVLENSEIEDANIHLQMMQTKILLTPHATLANRLQRLRNDFLSRNLSGVAAIIQDSCHAQLISMSDSMKQLIRSTSPIHRLLNQFYNIAHEKLLLLSYCRQLVSSNKSDFTLSTSLSQLFQFTRQVQYQQVLRDVNKHIVLSLTTFLSQSATATQQDSYLARLCGDTGTTHDKTVNEIQLLRCLRENLHSSEDYDHLYEKCIKTATTFENLEELLAAADSLGLDGMLKSVLSPATSPDTVSSLVKDYLEAIHLISVVFLPVSSHRMLQHNEVTMAHLLTLGVSRRHIIQLKCSDNKVVYDAPHPLQSVITKKHSERYTSTREQFLLLSESYKALLQMGLRDNLFLPGEDRIAFFRRNKMITIVRCLLSHVVSMVRIIQEEMEAELRKVSSVVDLINVQRRMMRQMFKRIRLETNNTSAIRLITSISDFCSLFAAAFAQGDARSCDIHYNQFYDRIRVLSEKLGTETDNVYAKILLVQLDRWGFMDSRKSEARSTVSLGSQPDSTLS